MLKGRVPPDKDVKKEITQALRLGKPVFSFCMSYFVLSLRNFTFTVSVASLFYYYNQNECVGISLSKSISFGFRLSILCT